MELEQLHEAGSSQAEQRSAAERGVADATAKVERLEEAVRKKKKLFEEANGEVGLGWVGLNGVRMAFCMCLSVC